MPAVRTTGDAGLDLSTDLTELVDRLLRAAQTSGAARLEAAASNVAASAEASAPVRTGEYKRSITIIRKIEDGGLTIRIGVRVVNKAKFIRFGVKGPGDRGHLVWKETIQDPMKKKHLELVGVLSQDLRQAADGR